MLPSSLRETLAMLRWSQRGLAEALGCDDRIVRRWAAGEAAMPADVALWLSKLAKAHEANPPPQAWRTRRLAAATGQARLKQDIRQAHVKHA